MGGVGSDDPVNDAARAYVDRALELLRWRCPAADDTELELGFPRWVEDTELVGTITKVGSRTLFRLVPDMWDPHRVCAQRELVRFPSERLPEYGELVGAMEADPILRGRLGDEVVGGAGLGGGPLQAEVVASELVLAIVEQAGGFDPPPGTVASTVERWFGHLRREQEKVVVLAPLSDCDFASVPVKLADDVTIDELTSEEIAAVLHFGSWPVSEFEQLTMTSQLRPTVHVGQCHAIRLSYSVPVVRGGGTPEQIEATLSAQSDAQRTVEEVLLALRLFRAGRVGLRGVLSLVELPLGGVRAFMATRSGHPRPIRGEPYVLAGDEDVALGELYQRLHVAKSNPLIDAATRRFGYAADRGLADDEIVDLIIAAESLFLGELGKPSERGEMTYRLATRAASFAEGGADDRRRVLQFVRRAYRARSGIVHSGRFDEAELRDLSGHRVTSAKFTDDLEGLLRWSLKKALRLHASGAGFPPDWDELVFPA